MDRAPTAVNGDIRAQGHTRTQRGQNQKFSRGDAPANPGVAHVYVYVYVYV